MLLTVVPADRPAAPWGGPTEFNSTDPHDILFPQPLRWHFDDATLAESVILSTFVWSWWHDIESGSIIEPTHKFSWIQTNISSFLWLLGGNHCLRKVFSNSLLTNNSSYRTSKYQARSDDAVEIVWHNLQRFCHRNEQKWHWLKSFGHVTSVSVSLNLKQRRKLLIALVS